MYFLIRALAAFIEDTDPSCATSFSAKVAPTKAWLCTAASRRERGNTIMRKRTRWRLI